MLTLAEARDVADRVAAEVLGGRKAAVEVEEAADWTGEDSLYVTVVLSRDAPLISGAQAADASSRIYEAIQQAGDQRFAFVHFATEDELRHDADPES